MSSPLHGIVERIYKCDHVIGEKQALDQTGLDFDLIGTILNLFHNKFVCRIYFTKLLFLQGNLLQPKLLRRSLHNNKILRYQQIDM